MSAVYKSSRWRHACKDFSRFPHCEVLEIKAKLGRTWAPAIILCSRRAVEHGMAFDQPGEECQRGEEWAWSNHAQGGWIPLCFAARRNTKPAVSVGDAQEVVRMV